MSFTFKSLVLFIKIVTKLLLLRPLGYYMLEDSFKTRMPLSQVLWT